MFLSKETVEKVYVQLALIDPESDGSDGKRAGERLSALRYFLATCAGLKRHSIRQLPLDTTKPQNRKDFITDVGDVVRLKKDDSDKGPYTNNFKNDISNISGFGAGNNFLTGSLTTNGNYPGRPKNSALIVRNNLALELNPKWKTNLSSYGEFQEYAAALALWLCRFDDLIASAETTAEYATKIKDILTDRYGADLANILCSAQSKLESFLLDSDQQLIVSPVCTSDLTFLLDGQNEKHRNHFLSASHEDSNAENVIYYGAPGTGKSFEINEKTSNYINTRVVFHSEYQNSDFVGSLRPSMNGKDISYRFVPGPFTKAFVRAHKNPDKPHALIIEEINRANAAAVFGDVFQLLDRKDDGTSEYPVSPEEQLKDFILNELNSNEPSVPWDGELRLPKNLSILATMNSADQGVLPMDAAFKRRWRFEYVPLSFEKCAMGEVEHNGTKYEWRHFAQAVNKVLIRLNVEEDRLLGPWFLSASDLKAGRKAVAGKLFVYLWDDVLRHLPRNRIFDCEERSFGDVCAAYLRGEPILSEELLQELNSGAKDTKPEENSPAEEASEPGAQAVEA